MCIRDSLPGGPQLAGQALDRGVLTAQLTDRPSHLPARQRTARTHQRRVLLDEHPDRAPGVSGTTPGTSCRTRTRRPRPTATTPHAGQPINCHGIETVTVVAVGPRSTCSTWTPSRPSSRSQRAHGSVEGAPGRAVALDTVEVLETVGSLVASDPRGPRPRQPRTQPTGEPPPPPEVR